jgi:hypothetical protein
LVTLAAIFPPTQPPERIGAVAAAADAAGLAELWVWEDCFKESGIATATAMRRQPGRGPGGGRSPAFWARCRARPG